MNSTQKEKYIDCLLEDYKVIKSEISRRSILQRVALVSYGGVITFILKNGNLYFEAPCELKERILLLIWLASFITQCFYIAEDFAIKRAAFLIVDISDRIQKQLGFSSKEAEDNIVIFPSIASIYEMEKYESYCQEKIRQAANSIFFISYFLGIPIYFDYFLNLYNQIPFVEKIPFLVGHNPVMLVMIIASLCATCFILISLVFFGNRFIKRTKQ